ncbi:MAG: NAD(P)H-dependent oxidoreductase [archaeon]|nr:NAD(P)H-dependent oxidoreductase [archaeon]
MEKLLFVNACVNRERSRTLRLAREVIARHPECEVDEIVLEDLGLRPLDSETVDRRNGLAREGRFDDPIFDIAHRFADADVIVIATPFWENAFNSMTKIFMEHSGAVGVAFRYSESGMPVGMCRARRLYYVTTRGGPVPDEGDLGFRIYENVAHTYGIEDVRCISASALDIITNDAEAIMSEAVEKVRTMLI